jgi:hypothetical protein
MEGSLFGLDLDWEGEVDNLDWTAADDDEILSCIEDFSGEDILWASVAIEREGINLFDSKVLDFLLSNEDADLIEKSLAALFKAEEGKNVLNNDFEFTEDILGAARDFEEEINPLDEPSCSEDSTEWPSTCSAPEEDPSTQPTTATFGEEKRFKALKKRRALHRKAGNSTDWRRGDKIQRKDLSFIKTEETVAETTPSTSAKMEIEEEQPEAPHQLPPAAIPTNDNVQEDNEEFFNVEDIVARRLKKRKRNESNVPTCPEDYYEYKVKWEGYGVEADSWEPYANVSHCNEHLDRLNELLEKKKQKQPLKKTRATAVQRKSTTRNSLTSSGRSQVSDTNNNLEHFDRNDEEGRKRKRVKQEQLSDDEDGDELWVLPEAKKRNIGSKAVSSVPTRKIPKRVASSFRN